MRGGKGINQAGGMTQKNTRGEEKKNKFMNSEENEKETNFVDRDKKKKKSKNNKNTKKKKAEK